MGYSGYMNCNNGGDYGNDYGNCNRGGSAFALIVVLFILLIIVGTAFMRKDCY